MVTQFGTLSGTKGASGVGTAISSDRMSRHLFVNSVGGSNGHSGKQPNRAKLTIAGALAIAQSGDVIHLLGNFTEEITADNMLEDITIVGDSNRPRHADHARDGLGTVSGASWRQAASHGSTTPLLKVRGQGWRLVNLLMVPPSDAAAVYLDRNALSGSSEYDPSHFTAEGVRFAGGQSGIEDSGGAFNVHLKDCVFHGATNGIKTLNTAVAQPLGWVIEDCDFWGNTNHILADFTQAVIRRNTFGKFTTQSIKLDQVGNTGGYNSIHMNALSGTYSIVGGYKKNAATDEWGGNWNSIAGGVTADVPA